MKVLITDDEAPARERLRRLLGELGIEPVAEAANGAEAIALAERLGPDLVLMDIRMPGIDGLEAAMHLASGSSPPAVVFTTAYGDHALAAFEAHAVDYLLKPVRRDRLEQALSRAGSLREAQRLGLREAAGGEGRSHVCARGAGAIRLIPVTEVIYFRAEDKYTTVRHLGGVALIEDSLRSLEEEFPGRFLRIHRNTLIAMEYFTGIERSPAGVHGALLRGTDERPEISRRHLAEVRALIARRA